MFVELAGVALCYALLLGVGGFVAGFGWSLSSRLVSRILRDKKEVTLD